MIGRSLDQVSQFSSLRTASEDGRLNKELDKRIHQATVATHHLQIANGRLLYTTSFVHKVVFLPTLLYGTESCVRRQRVNQRLKALRQDRVMA